MNKSRSVVSFKIEHPKGPASSFSSKKPRAGLLVSLNDLDELVLPVAKDTARHLQQQKDQLQGMSECEFMEALACIDRDAAWLRLLALVKRHDYSVYDMRLKLQALGFQSDTVNVAIERALDHKFLDDTRYANAYVRSKVSSGWGRSRIEKSLAHKGIESEILSNETLELMSDEAELERAVRILTRKSIPTQNAEQKFIRFLVGRGYCYSISCQAARLRIEAEDINNDIY